MDRIFIPSSARDGDRFVVRGAERRHLTALRVRPGERFLATDGEGHEFLLEARTVSKAEVTAEIREERTLPRGPGARLTLAVAPPRGTRMETAVEKATECGAGRIVPIETERSVVRGRGDSERIGRWRRIACSAVAQSDGAWAPEIGPFVPFAQALESATGGRVLLAHPAAGARPLAAALAGVPDDEPITVLVGPEGGFTDAEVDLARRRGAVAVSLGPSRLRTETAAIVATALAVAALERPAREES